MSKSIVLKSLALKNFKGIKDLHIYFERVTNIFGGNGVGKTTIFDSFNWLLFGKDSKDRKDYEIKTLDGNNKVLHGLEHSVTGVLEVDGEPITIQRMYKEKWTKRKGLADKVFTGHETSYYINEVPLKQKEFTEKIDSILTDSTFKLISNPLYFNTLHWTKQREILFEIIGDVNHQDVISNKKSLKALKALLGSNTVEDFRKQIKARISKYTKDKESIPYRVDECNNSIVNVDFASLEKDKQELLEKIHTIDEQIADSSKGNEVKLKLQDKVYELKNKLQEGLTNAKANQEAPLIELKKKINEIDSKIQDINFNIKTKENEKKNLRTLLNNDAELIQTYEKQQKELREEWHLENKKTFEFDENSTVCPTCKREYDHKYLEEIKSAAEEDFNSKKKKKLLSIQEKGKHLGKLIEDVNSKKYSDDIASIEKDIMGLTALRSVTKREKESLESDVKAFMPNETAFDGKEELEKQIHDLELEIASHSVDNSDLKLKKAELSITLDEVNSKLAKKENNEVLQARIQELKDEERSIAESIAELEGQDFLCEEFIRTKVDLLEEKINSKFKTVRFKLFNELNNGGLEDCCEALINGVPFSAANTASQINAGLEIINTLSEHYEVVAPIFLDNRESVNEIVSVKGQVINLIVSKDTTLRIEGEDNE